MACPALTVCAPLLVTAKAIVSIYLEQRENIPIVLHHFLGQPCRRLFTQQEFNQILFLFTRDETCSKLGRLMLSRRTSAGCS